MLGSARGAGAKVVVAQSFARIFFRNCVATCAPRRLLCTAMWGRRNSRSVHGDVGQRDSEPSSLRLCEHRSRLLP